MDWLGGMPWTLIPRYPREVVGVATVTSTTTTTTTTHHSQWVREFVVERRLFLQPSATLLRLSRDYGGTGHVDIFMHRRYAFMYENHPGLG